MNKIRLLTEHIIKELYFFNLLLLPFSLVLCALTSDIKHALLLLLLLPVMGVHYFFRHHIKSFLPFVIVTWLTCIIGFFFDYKLVYLLFLAAMSARSVKLRTSPSVPMTVTFESVCFPMALIAVMYAYAKFMGNEGFQEMLFIQANILLVLAMLYSHIRSLNIETELDNSETLQPIERIHGFTNKVLVAYVLCFLFTGLVFRYVPFGEVLLFILRMIFSAIGFIISLISSAGGDSYSEPTGSSALPEAGAVETQELPYWLKLIEQFFIYFANILVVLIILAGIAYFFIMIYRGFYAHRHKAAAPDRGYVSKVTDIRHERRQKKPTAKPKDPIRRAYFNRVNKYFGKGLLRGSYTPLEIKKRLEGKENLEELTAKYEDVRYKNTLQTTENGL